ncbi:hypothetical protein QS329_23920, partial [Escherichia coli]|nr:hypothetical protein [Escherichia coli]MDL7601684.1 hypothetical protein [Escherichia coli]MDL8813441.1 hypothetical protein [Escherichia coli]MDL9679156.1 hypothetical protein [Escherichia coli]MDL9915018.1 hypothetical protein [Escherichia coli]
MSEQITFATSDFASNPEPRCPCILLLDVSGSMNGRPINELNAGLVTFRDELLDAPRDKCTLSCAINGIHAAFHYLKKNYISGCVMTVPT